MLVTRVGGRELVAAACERSLAAGVRIGMDVSNAKALLPSGDVCTLAHRPERDAAALTALACWMNRYAPVVAPDPPDGLLMDVSGTQRLYRGESKLLGVISAALSWLGVRSRLALASTFGCAWAVAHYGGGLAMAVPEGMERQALRALPVRALRVDQEVADGLAEVGVTTIGELLEVPRSSLPSRFGAGLLLRLDQALGNAIEMIEPVRPQPPMRVELEFDGPTTQYEAVEMASRELISGLCAELARQERGVRRMELRLTRIDAESESIVVMLSRPTRSERHLWLLMRTRLERANLGHGVEGLSLTAAHTARLRHEQSRGIGPAARADASEIEQAGAELIDTISNRLGPDAAVRFDAVESHLPERAFRAHPAGPDVRCAGVALDDAAITQAPRPSRLFARPEPATVIVLTPDGPVMSIAWRGRDWRVETSIGPERVCPEWWHDAAEAPDRDYYRVQVDGGRWLWMCRELRRWRWFVHGEWA